MKILQGNDKGDEAVRHWPKPVWGKHLFLVTLTENAPGAWTP